MLSDLRPLALQTDDGVTLAADVLVPRRPAGSAVVLVHGFAAHRRDPAVEAVARALSAAGHVVISYDGRGHGQSGGLCTLGDREGLDVAAAVDAARDLAPRVVLVGASLGAIAVLRHGADDHEVAGVVTVSSPAAWRLRSPRAALAAVVTRTAPGRRLALRMGVRLDRRWRRTEAPDALAARTRVPLAVVHGTDDRFMPASEARALHRAGRGPAPRRLDVVRRMGHAFCPHSHGPVLDAVDWCLTTRPSPLARQDQLRSGRGPGAPGRGGTSP